MQDVPGASSAPDPSEILSEAIDTFETFDDDEDTPEPAAAPTPNDPPKSGRTPDEVRGELLRRNQKLESKLDQMNAALQQALAAIQTGVQRPVQTPSAVEDYSLEQLQASEDAVYASGDARAIAKYNTLIAQKTAEQASVAAFQRAQNAQTVRDATMAYTKEAMEQFGSLGLRDKTSEFYARTQAEISRRQSWGPVPPSINYDAAAYVAAQMGVAPSAPTPRRGTSPLAAGRTKAPVGGANKVPDGHDAVVAEMEARQGFKFSEEAKARMRQAAINLEKDKHLYIGNGNN